MNREYFWSGFGQEEVVLRGRQLRIFVEIAACVLCCDIWFFRRFPCSQIFLEVSFSTNRGLEPALNAHVQSSNVTAWEENGERERAD